MPNVCESFSGDYEGAIDTLRMAITLIKQSVTANSEVRHCALRAQRLVQCPLYSHFATDNLHYMYRDGSQE